MTEDCPDDSELWPFAAGETVDEELTAHVTLCERCSRKVQALQTEFESIRGAALSAKAERPNRPCSSTKLGITRSCHFWHTEDRPTSIELGIHG